MSEEHHDHHEHGDRHGHHDYDEHHEDDDHHDHDGHHDHGEAGTHDHHHYDLETVGAAVITVSSTRTVDDDPAGDAIEELLADAGHEVVAREVIPDDFEAVRETVERAVANDAVDAVVTTGGTGITRDDVTVEACAVLFDKELPGFGELFRQLSRDEVGTRVVGTRAVAGVVTVNPTEGNPVHGVPVFCLPGSENAARLGTREIVVPEAPHLAGLARRS
ncbi:MogA/MoaB family molybdenum cofactor biosynthesis protein [Halomarina pelagica]|uniref:MogA/MoaB family molybdenum cofactor biosynthesis protein n=1 Tax=Halomarina pelagica TaxID=2961599 RepID=UPI0020C4C827|nr:MogA/MoaB family molybdenum cofactor biosynthesis protein [Halomarina sp. BND7]